MDVRRGSTCRALVEDSGRPRSAWCASVGCWPSTVSWSSIVCRRLKTRRVTRFHVSFGASPQNDNKGSVSNFDRKVWMSEKLTFLYSKICCDFCIIVYLNISIFLFFLLFVPMLIHHLTVSQTTAHGTTASTWAPSCGTVGNLIFLHDIVKNNVK